ncbi:MAG: type II secretion system protein [Deltaproteobacteria bacterium]|nr:type II secretion system protein [Deltaproteobacteria bacterium]
MKKQDERGFTLIEMLLVMVIMGIMLAVIVPRAWRANVDSKYTLVRQNGTELVAFASNWAENSLLAQNDDCDCSMKAYYDTLTGWLAAATNANNWANTTKVVVGRRLGTGTTDVTPENTVSAVIDPSRIPRNPFNGASVFVASNLPGASAPVPGAICCKSVLDGGLTLFALLFQGTDCTSNTDFYAGQGAGTTVAEIRNGIFMAKLN